MTEAANVYGQALYELARDEGLAPRILGELNVLNASFAQEPVFVQLLASPTVPKQERCQIIDSSLRSQVHPYVLNFLKILTEKGIAKQFAACVDAFVALYNQDHDILPVTAVTAVALTQEQSARLTEKLSKLTGKNAKLHNRVDPQCLGGVLLDYDGKRVDGSVASRLAAVRDLLKNTVL